MDDRLSVCEPIELSMLNTRSLKVFSEPLLMSEDKPGSRGLED